MHPSDCCYLTCTVCCMLQTKKKTSQKKAAHFLGHKSTDEDCSSFANDKIPRNSWPAIQIEKKKKNKQINQKVDSSVSQQLVSSTAFHFVGSVDRTIGPPRRVTGISSWSIPASRSPSSCIGAAMREKLVGGHRIHRPMETAGRLTARTISHELHTPSGLATENNGPRSDTKMINVQF